MLRKQTVKTLLVLTLVMLALTALFFWVVRENWDDTSVRSEPISAYGVLPVSGETRVIDQAFPAEADRVELIGFVPAALGETGAGEFRLSLLDAAGQEKWAQTIPAEALRLDELNEFPLEEPVRVVRGEELTLRLEPGETGLSAQYGKTVSAGRVEVTAADTDRLTLNGEGFQGRLLMAVQGSDHLGLSWLAWLLGGLIWLGLCAAVLATDRAIQTGRDKVFFRRSEIARRFSYLLKTLVLRDFKIKYQASLLGVLWSFLNPLLTMAVYLFVFSTIFKSNIEYFPAYLLTGIVMFNYFSESTSLGLNSIVGNRALITKVYMPKVIYPVSKVLSSAINLFISFIPMIIVLLITGVPIHKSFLLLPLAVAFLIAFCLGVTMILSTMTVFFRDTQFLWGILITIWNFLTPIFYPESIIPAAFRTLYHLNPLYQIIYFMRCVTIGGVSPTPVTYLYCFLVSAVPLLLGLLVFRRKQDRFVLYL